VEESGTPPFASGPFMFAHNGAIEDFRRTAMRPLRDALSDESYAGLLGTTDSEMIFAGLLDRLRENSGDPAEATVETVRRVSGVCAKRGVRATLNLGVTDGKAMAFARHATEGPGNSLYFVEDGEAFPGAVVVASERLDGDPRWREVPDRHLLTVDGNGASLRTL
jgi:glutamine amidotransferase